MSKKKKIVKKEKKVYLTLKEAKLLCEELELIIDWDGGDYGEYEKTIEILNNLEIRIKKAKVK